MLSYMNGAGLIYIIELVKVGKDNLTRLPSGKFCSIARVNYLLVLCRETLTLNP